jgi:hypothetical protein
VAENITVISVHLYQAIATSLAYEGLFLPPDYTNTTTSVAIHTELE